MTRAYMLDTVAVCLNELRTSPPLQLVLYGIEEILGEDHVIVIADYKERHGLVPLARALDVRKRSRFGLPVVVRRFRETGWDYVLDFGRDLIPLTILPYTHDYYARHAGLVDPSLLGKKHVVVVGVGSLGMPVALHLARAGVGTIKLIDADLVSLENLTRSGFSVCQLGMRKVDATTEIIMAANPGVTVEPIGQTLDKAQTEKPDLFDDVDLAIGTASNAVAFGLAARLHRRVPLIFPGLHARAESGEIFVSGGRDHAERPCFACFRARVRPSAPTSRTWNYQSSDGELVSEPGLGPDIGHVATIASSIAVQMLPGASDKVIDFERPLLLLSNRKGSLFEHAYESRWIVVPRDPECPNHEEPVDATPEDEGLVAALASE